MCQCFPERPPAGISCWYRSRLCVRASVRSWLRIERIRPSLVVSHFVSEGLMTFFLDSHPGLHSCDHSCRGPKRDSSLNGADRPCWMRPRTIHDVLAFITSASARSVVERLWCLCLLSVWTMTRASFSQS